MDFFIEPLPDCVSHIQVGTRSHACDHERGSSSSISKSSNSSPDAIQDDNNGVNNVQVFNQLLRSKRAWPLLTMQQYNSQSNNNMAYNDARYTFNNGVAQELFNSRSSEDITPNMMLNFGGVMDPSASFPGLVELPSNGMEPAVEQNLTGTFTGDLNSSTAAYEVGDHHDHSRLLQEMLQQHPPLGQPDTHSPIPAAVTTHGDWEDSLHVLQEMVHLQQQQQQQAHQIYTTQTQMEQAAFNQNFSADRFRQSAAKFSSESELLNLLQFPRGTTTSAIPSFGYTGIRGKGPTVSATPVHTGNIYESYDSNLVNHHNLQSSSQQRYISGHNLSRRDSAAPEGAQAVLVDPGQEREDLSGKHLAASNHFGAKREHGAATSGKGEPRGVNHFATERQRREFLNEKYHTLRSLVPNPTKADRASIVADAIEYVKALKRTVQELQQLVQEKRRESSSIKRRRSMDACSTEVGYNNNVGSSTTPEKGNNNNNESFSPPGDGSSSQQLRCSWLQRTSQNGTLVDVRIVHDEVTIKVNQRRRKILHCLLFDVIAVLQDLQLDLVQASGATVGEHDVFLFNTKILEGSSTFASYIAVKLLDTLDRHFVI